MPRLPGITGREAIRAFEKAGFVVARIRGSHHILKKAALQYCVSIPVHEGRTVSKGLLRRQIRLAGMTEEEFIALL